MALDPSPAAIPTIGLAPPIEEKLLSKIFKQSWLAILVWIIGGAFALGVTYASLTGQVQSNTSRMNLMDTTEGATRLELLNQIQMNKQDMTDRLNAMDKKLDDINKYLRDHK